MSELISVVTFGLEWRMNNAAVSGRCPLLLTEFSPSFGPWLFCTRTGSPVDMDAISEARMNVQTLCPNDVRQQLGPLSKYITQPWGKAGRIDYALSVKAPQAPRILLSQLHQAFTGPSDRWSNDERIGLLAVSAAVFDAMASDRPDTLWSSIVKGVDRHLPILVASASVLLPHMEAFRQHLPTLASHLSQEHLEDSLPKHLSPGPKLRF